MYNKIIKINMALNCFTEIITSIKKCIHFSMPSQIPNLNLSDPEYAFGEITEIVIILSL